MKAIVDEDLCTGCDVAKVKGEEIAADAEDCAKQAAEECPVEAIKVE